MLRRSGAGERNNTKPGSISLHIPGAISERKAGIIKNKYHCNSIGYTSRINVLSLIEIVLPV